MGSAIVDKLTRLLGTALDDTVRRADDPETLLHALIAEMTRDLVTAKNHLAACHKEEQRLTKQVEIAAKIAADWSLRARSAVRAGDDVIARDALVRQHQHERQADDLRVALEGQRRDAVHLRNALVGLNLRIEEAKLKRNGILLRIRRAEGERAMEQVLLKTPPGAPADVLDEIDRRVARVEDESALLPELTDDALAAPGAAPAPKKPLAKAQAREGARRTSSRDSVGVAAGQKRTKR
jgi:phage shock protein A